MEGVLLSAVGGFISGLVVSLPALYVLDRIGLDIFDSKHIWVYLGVTIPVAVALAILVVNPLLHRLAGV